ncbi:MAG: FAD-dependent thymidylate synthase [Pirellulales bacterium]
MPSNLAQVEALRWQKHPVLDDGFVTLVDCMGDDQAVVQAARVSYGEGTRKTSDDRGLIRYLLRHRHTTPFEMAEVKLLVRVPMDCWRQWIRHRTANVNEYSTRYSLAIEGTQTTQPGEWRTQAASNRQGSGAPLNLDLGEELTASEREFQTAAQVVRRPHQPRRGPRASAEGLAAVHVHRSVLEDRPAQLDPLSRTADGHARAVRDSDVRPHDRREDRAAAVSVGVGSVFGLRGPRDRADAFG